MLSGLRDRIRSARDAPNPLPPSWIHDESVVGPIRAAIRAFWAAVFEVNRERTAHRRLVTRAEARGQLGLGGKLLLLVLGGIMLIAGMTVLFIVESGALRSPPRTEVPSGLVGPGDIAIHTPAPGLPVRLAAFSGTWQGRWDGELLSRIVVERIDAHSARVVYMYAAAPDGSFPAGWSRLTADVSPKGSISWGFRGVRFTLTMSRDRTSISGRRDFPGGENFVTMRRVGDKTSDSEGPPTTFTAAGRHVTVSGAAMKLARTTQLRGVLADAIGRIDAALAPQHRADVRVFIGQGIPGVGVSGFTDPESGVVTIGLDAHSPIGVEASVTKWLPPTLAHELFESKRVLDGPGFGLNLGAWLVTDGGADNFAHSLYSGVGVFPWDRALTPAQEASMWTKARARLDATGGAHDFLSWFMGSAGIPHWTAYTIGYHVVSGYLSRHPGVTPADIATTPAQTVLDGSGYSA